MAGQDWKTMLQAAVKAAKKTEAGEEFTAEAYLVVPDPDKPSTWKLRIEESPGKVTVAQLGRAAAALGPGFRGQRVDLEPEDRRKAARKLIALYHQHDVADEDIPEYLWEIADMQKPEKSEAKSINLRALADQIVAQFRLWINNGGNGSAVAFADIWPVEVFNDHLIVSVYDQAAGSQVFYKVPFNEAIVQVVPGDPDALEVLESIEFADRAQWVRVLPTFVEFTTLKQADGRTRWVMVSSGGFEDRDGEVVSTEFLESAVKTADETGERGPLLIFHVPGAEIGTCDTQAIIGKTPGLLLESGLFADTEAGRRAAAYFAEHTKEYGGSIKFVYNRRTVDGVYLPPGMILERSVLPREYAAFPWSSVAVWEVEKMAGINETKLAELKKILGDELADQIVTGLAANIEQLKAAGIRWKEVSDQAAPAGDGTVPTEMEVVLTPDAMAAVAKEAAAAALAALQPLVDELRRDQAKLADDVAAMRRADDEKLAEKVRNLPRATVRVLQGEGIYRPTQRQGSSNAQQAKNLQEIGLQTLYGARE